MIPLKFLLVIILLSIFTTACNEIPPVITPVDTSSAANQLETANVLIEEFGGVLS